MSQVFLSAGKLIYTVLLLLISGSLLAQSRHIWEIPLDGSGLAANDLVYNGEVLNPEQAMRLSRQRGVDLSSLDPRHSEIWAPNHIWMEGDYRYMQAESILSAIEAEDTLHFAETLNSHSGLMRFNTRSENSSHVFTLHMNKTLHTYLLRHQLLKRLGYRLPPVRYISKLWVEFESVEQRDHFLGRSIPQQALASSSRWIVEKEETRVLLQDIAITTPDQHDHFDVAMGVPPRYLASRSLRSLLIAYALLDLDESVNQFDWYVGRIQDEHILLPHFIPASFATTMDDARWILSKIAEFSRRDFERIVAGAYFPTAVERLLIEKIISRRNSLVKLFDIDAPAIAVNYNVSFMPYLEDGRLLKEEWGGYASRFSYGVVDSPFDSLGYYFLANIQSSMIDQVVNMANSVMDIFDADQARGNFLMQQFEDGMQHFVDTGEFATQNIGAWVTPVVSGQLVTARDIVIGPYMGTDNLVQRADTFGYGARVGVQVGFDSIDSYMGFGVGTSLYYLRTFTHLSPVENIKEALKTPYKNLFVPHIRNRIENAMEGLVRLNHLDISQEERERILQEFAQEIDQRLAVGDSLIISERITPDIKGSMSVSYRGARMTIGGYARYTDLKRTHLHRKDGNTIQVYVDHGKSRNLGLNFRFDQFIPVLEIRYDNHKGQYDVEMYEMDLTQNLEENPDLVDMALGVAHLLDSGSSEVLEAFQAPYRLHSQFVDNSSRLSIFHWRSRALNKNGIYSITNPQGHQNHFVQVSDATQMGVNYMDFLRDVGNFLIGRYLSDVPVLGDFTLAGNRWQNPARTFFGMAETKGGRFEARLMDNGSDEVKSYEMQEMFLNIRSQTEGWRSSRNHIIRKMLEINEMVGRDIFHDDFIRDTAAMFLYNLEVNINIYRTGIERLLRLDDDLLAGLERQYRRNSGFERRCQEVRYRNRPECGNFRFIRQKNARCQRLSRQEDSNAYRVGRCLLRLSLKLEEVLDFDHFVRIVGAENIYIYGVLTGFRTESEVLLEPIFSHSSGQISSRFWNGPLEAMRLRTGIQAGEFFGNWLREDL